MNIDLHYHTILTSKLPFSFDYLEQSVDAASRAGLDAIAMTDHLSSPHYGTVHGQMRARYERRGDAYVVRDMLVFPGMEIDVAEGPHVLVIARSEACDVIYAVLEHQRDKGSFPPIERILDLAEEHDGLIICAHPLRPRRELRQVPAGLWGRFDAFDINGKDLFRMGLDMKTAVEAFAREAGVPTTGGSDTHHYLQAGAVYNQFPDEVLTVAGLKRAVAELQHTVIVDACLDVRVEAATIVKKTLRRYVFAD